MLYLSRYNYFNANIIKSMLDNIIRIYTVNTLDPIMYLG